MSNFWKDNSKCNKIETSNFQKIFKVKMKNEEENINLRLFQICNYFFHSFIGSDVTALQKHPKNPKKAILECFRGTISSESIKL